MFQLFEWQGIIGLNLKPVKQGDDSTVTDGLVYQFCVHETSVHSTVPLQPWSAQV